MTTNASGTVQTAGCPSSGAPEPCAAAPSIITTIAQQQAPPPTTTPAVAPIQVRRRHQMPSTIRGQNDDAAMANAQPTSRPREKRLTGSAATVATAPASTAHSRNGPTPPRMTSCDSAPATLTSSPEEVDRKAANAPAATSAARSSPGRPSEREEIKSFGAE